MKKNFKFLMIIVILITGFISCNNDNETSPNESINPKSVTVKVKIGETTTYSEGATAVGVTPDLTDLKLFFTDGTNILATRTATVGSITTISGETFTNVPGAATKIIVVGNATVLTSPILPTTGTEAALKAAMIEISKQTHPKTAVNLQGEGLISVTAGVYTAALDIYPAVSHIEIAQVIAKTSGNGAQYPLTAFKLTAIYINNTYTKLGMDRSTLPTGVDILNYGQNATQWTASYPARFCDLPVGPATELGGTTTTKAPTTAGQKWGYFVVSPLINKGTTIDAAVQSSVPHIILKIENAVTSVSGVVLPSPAYITVRSLKNGVTALTALDPGKVYSIASIDIAGENLSAKPETAAKADINVTVTVHPWTDVTVTPDL